MLFQVLTLAHLVLPLMSVAALVGVFFVGPRRWVRVATALTLADALFVQSFELGLGRAAVCLLTVVAVVVVANYVAFLTWRTPRHIHYATGAGLAWPSHAAKDVERWSQELVHLGFEQVPDVWYAWRYGGTSRSSMVRLFKHPAESIWVSVYAVVSPRAHSRAVYTRLADGRWFQTATRASDATVLPDASIVTQRVGSDVSCSAVIAAHRAGIAKVGAPAASIGDVLEEHRAAREAWLSGLLARGQVRVDGESVAIAPKAILGMIPRQFAGWLT